MINPLRKGSPSYYSAVTIFLSLVAAALLAVIELKIAESAQLGKIKAQVCQMDASRTARSHQRGEYTEDLGHHILIAHDARGREIGFGWQCVAPGLPSINYVLGPEPRFNKKGKEAQEDPELRRMFEENFIAQSSAIFKALTPDP